MKEFVWPLRVYYEDTDAGGVVYYANYLKFMERARTEWLRHYGIEQDVLRREHSLLFVVREVHLSYLQPARFNDALTVHCRLEEMRGASFSMAQRIVNKDKAILCRGEVKLACIHETSGRAQRLPAFLKHMADHNERS